MEDHKLNSWQQEINNPCGTLGQEKIRRIVIAEPPIKEQQEIVRRVEALFKTAALLEDRYQKARAYVDNLTQSILARAFRGELVPRDAKDES